MPGTLRSIRDLVKRPPHSFRYELRSKQHLEELATSALPLGTDCTEPRSSQHRDLYLDTVEDTLRKRNIVCRLRLCADDTRTLSLRIGSAGHGEDGRIDSRVEASEVVAAIAENTAAGRSLRALIDPSSLVVRIELETERLTRKADFNWLRQPRMEIHYDYIVVRRGRMSASFRQMCMHRRHGKTEGMDGVARAFEREHHLRPIPGGPRDRAELLLKWKGGGEKENTSERSAVIQPSPTGTPPEIPEFLNPELSLLAFQSRVLTLAENKQTPLRERLKFLSIVSANLDEFFMVRMAGLRRAAREQYEEQCDDGLTRGEQLRLIAEQVSSITERQTRCLEDCLATLAEHGVRIVQWDDLDADRQSALRAECREQIYPSLTPMAMTLSPGHPLPHLPHLTLALAVVMRDSTTGRIHLAELELPPDVPRFLPVPGQQGHVVTIEEVIRSNIDLLYPDRKVEGVYGFRVTRGGDLDLDEEAADDLIEAVASAAERRHYNPAVRVEVERDMPDFVRSLLLGNLKRETSEEEAELEPADVNETSALLDLGSLMRLPVPANPSFSYGPFQAAEHFGEGESILDGIREGDLIFHHPFDSFASTVVKYLREAAADPDVTAIKITLYRVGDSSAIVDALLDAARNGKKVVAFVELKARFDEEHNVAWARKLERAGGHVVSGLVGIKNHAKVALVIRRENGKMGSYVHVGTGNYNSKSGREYTDLSLFSAREEVTADAADLFNSLTGGSLPPTGLSRGALVAPHQMRDAILTMIEREAAHARAGRPARITAKVNGLSDAEVVRALIYASTDGVTVDLIVRGICTLRPGVPGRSERIRVVSVLGRLLEHSRIYRFENDGVPEVFIGSADLRPRNLRRRVELLVPVVEREHQQQLDRILDLYLNDPTAWDLTSTGEYVPRKGKGPGAQETLIASLESVSSGAEVT
ncbi:MAG: polyphosphate kinase 1 [Gemmatimonadaceae bacterium]